MGTLLISGDKKNRQLTFICDHVWIATLNVMSNIFICYFWSSLLELEGKMILFCIKSPCTPPVSHQAQRPEGPIHPSAVSAIIICKKKSLWFSRQNSFEFISHQWRVVEYTSWLPVPSNAAGVVGKHFALHVRAHKVLIVPHHLH